MQGLWLIFNVVLVNIILSGDNALAISLAASRLPAPLRRKAVWSGTVLAVACLMIFTTLGTLVIRLPVLKTVAGALLLVIAVRLAAEHLAPHDEEAATTLPAATSFGKAIATIVLADLSMELDNAMAMLGAASGHVAILLIGFACTLPFLLFGSRIIAKVFDRWPWIVFPAAAYIALIGGRLVGDDVVYASTAAAGILQWAAPYAAEVIFAGALVMTWAITRHRARAAAAVRAADREVPNGVGQ